MPTITLTISGDEQPDSVSLRTLTRSDTGDAVAGVSLPADFTGDAGSWTYTFTAPATGLHYDYTFRMTWSDGTFNDAAGSLDESGASPTYATAATLVMKYGQRMVNGASNTGVEGNSTMNEARVNAALAWAFRYINQYLGSVGVALPTTTQSASLGDIEVDLAYSYLRTPDVYRDDETGVGRELFFAKRDAKQRLQHLALFGMGGAVLSSETDARPTWDGQ